MVNVVFSGSVQFQAAAGETVTLQVTKPDMTIDTFTTVTLADKSYTITKPYAVAGNYSVVAHVDADAEYLSADSSRVPFVVSLAARTITVAVGFV